MPKLYPRGVGISIELQQEQKRIERHKLYTEKKYKHRRVKCQESILYSYRQVRHSCIWCRSSHCRQKPTPLSNRTDWILKRLRVASVVSVIGFTKWERGYRVAVELPVASRQSTVDCVVVERGSPSISLNQDVCDQEKLYLSVFRLWKLEDTQQHLSFRP